MQLAWKAVLAHSTPACQEPNLVAEPPWYCIPFVKSASLLFGILLFCPRPEITVHPQKNFTSGKTPMPHWSREGGPKCRWRPAGNWTEQATRQRLNYRLDWDRNWTNEGMRGRCGGAQNHRRQTELNKTQILETQKNKQKEKRVTGPWRTLSIT